MVNPSMAPRRKTCTRTGRVRTRRGAAEACPERSVAAAREAELESNVRREKPDSSGWCWSCSFFMGASLVPLESGEGRGEHEAVEHRLDVERAGVVVDVALQRPLLVGR